MIRSGGTPSPMSLSRNTCDTAMTGDPAEHKDERRSHGAVEPPSDPNVAQLTAVSQRKNAGDLEHPFAHRPVAAVHPCPDLCLSLALPGHRDRPSGRKKRQEHPRAVVDGAVLRALKPRSSRSDRAVAAGVGTMRIVVSRGVPRRQRACPSAGLDERRDANCRPFSRQPHRSCHGCFDVVLY